MNPLEELEIYFESLISVIEQDRAFFAPVLPFIGRMNHLLVVQKSLSQDDLKSLFNKVEAFYALYRPSGDTLYIPPPLISSSEHIIEEVKKLV